MKSLLEIANDPYDVVEELWNSLYNETYRSGGWAGSETSDYKVYRTEKRFPDKKPYDIREILESFNIFPSPELIKKIHVAFKKSNNNKDTFINLSYKLIAPLVRNTKEIKEADFDFEQDGRKTKKRTKFKKTPEVVALTGTPSLTKNNPSIRDK